MTVVVILGVLVGPGVVNCFNSPDGMGLCLQGKLRDAGLLPAGTSPVQADASATPGVPAAPAVPETSSETAIVEPELDVTPLDAAAAAAMAAPENLIAATFGLLRAEPDGSVVIAGSGTPGSEIEVYSNGTLLGKTIVEASGDWVLVPDVRIAPGGTEITLGETGKQGLAPQSFVVAINEDKTSEPLVVASTPGAVSEVLQGLPRPGADTATQMATADTSAPAAAKPAIAAQADATAAAIAETAVTPPATAVATIASSAAAPAATSAATAAPAVATTAQPAATAETAMPAAEAVATAATAATPAAIDQPAAAVTAAAQPEAAPAEPTTAIAAADAATPVAAPIAAAVSATTTPPTIDAVEVEGDKSFFAGSGTEGATVRLYVDDVFIADATVSGGRWLIEAGKVLTKPNQRVRIDMLQTGSADVSARAEVDFMIDMPASETPMALAQADGAAQSSDGATAPLSAETAAAAPAIPTMVAVSVGNLDDQRFAAGKAIIRRGDNLWTIARRVYGEGIKYTTIYEANTGQIRDPDRIYPGQVFNLPDGSNN